MTALVEHNLVVAPEWMESDEGPQKLPDVATVGEERRNDAADERKIDPLSEPVTGVVDACGSHCVPTVGDRTVGIMVDSDAVKRGEAVDYVHHASVRGHVCTSGQQSCMRGRAAAVTFNEGEPMSSSPAPAPLVAYGLYPLVVGGATIAAALVVSQGGNRSAVMPLILVSAIAICMMAEWRFPLDRRWSMTARSLCRRDFPYIVLGLVVERASEVAVAAIATRTVPAGGFGPIRVFLWRHRLLRRSWCSISRGTPTTVPRTARRACGGSMVHTTARVSCMC